jgi:hypothetical protein
MEQCGSLEKREYKKEKENGFQLFYPSSEKTNGVINHQVRE